MQAVAGAADAEAVGLDGEGAHARHLGDPPVDIGDDLCLAAAALLPRRQRQHHEAGIGTGAEAGDGENVLHLAIVAHRQDKAFQLAHLLACVFEADALRRGNAQQRDGAVLGWRQFLRNGAHQRKGRAGDDQRDHDDDERRIERLVQQDVVEPHHQAAEPAQPAGHRMAVVVLPAPDQPRRQHRAQRQRDDAGQQDREGEHKAEFAEQPAGLAGQEGNRDEHRGKRRRRCDDGEEDLARSDDGRGARAEPLVAFAHYVFKHDDGVVDDHAGGQHQREKRQDVDREPGQIDRRERAEQRDRQRDGRDQRGAPVEQEEEDDRDDDGDRQNERPAHLVDGAANEGRVVAGDADFDAFGQDLLHLRDGRAHAVGDFQRVRLRLADDAHADAGLAVGAQRRVARIGAERDRGDILELNPAVDEQVLEILRRGDVRRRAHDDVLRVGGQRAGRDVVGDACQRVAQIGDGQAEGRQPRLVDVDAEDLVAVAIDRHVGDARHRGKPIDHLVLDEDRHVLDGQGVGGDGEPHDRIGIGVRLDDARLVGAVGHVVGHAAKRVADIGGGASKGRCCRRIRW